MSIPFWPIFGGLLIGSAALMLFWLIGRVAGISGIFWNGLTRSSADRFWQLAFIGGLVLGAYLFHAVSGVPYPRINTDPQMAIAAGLLVGFGVKLGNGCTSGHGVCGIGRLSKRSIVATLIFMGVAICTVAVMNSNWLEALS